MTQTRRAPAIINLDNDDQAPEAPPNIAPAAAPTRVQDEPSVPQSADAWRPDLQTSTQDEAKDDLASITAVASVFLRLRRTASHQG